MTDLFAVFIVGFIGSAQCIGSCGSISFLLAQAQSHRKHRHLLQVLFYLGKAVTYSVLGALAGAASILFGGLLFDIQGALSIAGGLALTVVGIGILLSARQAPGAAHAWLFRAVSAVASGIHRLAAGGRSVPRRLSAPTMFSLGLVNGLLPCGIIYGLLVKAAATGTVIGGALTMAVFGLATVPALYIFAVAGFLLPAAWRARMHFVNGLLLLMLGLLTIARGGPALAAHVGDALDRYYVVDTLHRLLSRSDVKFEKVALPETAGQQHTAVAVGPDGKLYATTMRGQIRRWTIEPDGTLSHPEVIESLRDAEGGDRLTIGLAFDPEARADSLVVWVSHTTFGFHDMPDWGGKITRLSGPGLEAVQTFVDHLPRSVYDHVTNGLAFGPDGALYVCQGSNSAMGTPDSTWAYRPERLLNAAVLRVDVAALAAAPSLPLNVKTAEGGTYDPYAPEAPVRIFASGVRNAYDLVWHSNEQLYVPINGSAAGGRAPASVRGTLRPDGRRYNGPAIPSVLDLSVQSDFLIRVPPPEPDGSWPYRYYGHPNPARGEYVLNGGNPTAGPDPGEVDQYPVGVQPDAAWAGYIYDFGRNVSPNGIIEYRSDTFDGALKGKLLVVRYSVGDDILILDPATGHRGVMAVNLGVVGFDRFLDPLDLAENPATGDLYVAEFGKEGRITLLRPLDPDRNLAAR